MRVSLLRGFALASILVGVQSPAFAAHKSNPFQGPKANKGYVMHEVVNGKNVLTLSNDFVAPETPDPHWQVVDSKGNIYLLDRLTTKRNEMGDKPDKVKTSITLPSYVPDVIKVQIWCAWAEALLGEARFEEPVMSSR